MIGSLGNSYAFTWSPKGVTYEPFRKYREHIFDVFIKWRKAVAFTIYPELNVNGNIHYHGIINIIDKYAWYHCLLPSIKKMGFVVIKVLKTDKDIDKWLVYMEKERVVNTKVFEKGGPYPLTEKVLPKKVKQKPCPDLDMDGGILKYFGIKDNKE